MSRGWLSLAAPIAGCACVLAGCTLLIGFDEVPSADAGVDAQTPVGVPDVAVADAVVTTDALADADAGVDARDALANPDACKGRTDGKYCGGNGIVWPGSKDDLVTCKAQVVSSVRTCTSGVGCIRMLSGYPDQCDECAGKVDGVYCGRDMPGWEPANADTRVRCQNKAEVGLLLCASGCASNGAASACK